MRKVLFLSALLAFIFTSSVWAADISGTWTLKYKNPGNMDESINLVIKDVGGKLTITGTHSFLKEVVGTGTLKGDTVTISVETTGKEHVKFDFNGTVAGNKMSGTREIEIILPKPGTKEYEESQAASAASAAQEAADKAAGKPVPTRYTGPVAKDFTGEKK
jgi:hypothetical protein